MFTHKNAKLLPPYYIKHRLIKTESNHKISKKKGDIDSSTSPSMFGLNIITYGMTRLTHS